jgi:hypothetical protein
LRNQRLSKELLAVLGSVFWFWSLRFSFPSLFVCDSFGRPHNKHIQTCSCILTQARETMHNVAYTDKLAHRSCCQTFFRLGINCCQRSAGGKPSTGRSKFDSLVCQTTKSCAVDLLMICTANLFCEKNTMCSFVQLFCYERKIKCIRKKEKPNTPPSL